MTTASFVNAVGKKVYVTTTDGQRRKGRLQAVAPGSITLAAGKTTSQIGLEQVATIKKESHRIRNGLLIGLGAGLVPAVLLAFNCEDDSETCGGLFLGITALGIGAGAGVGVLLNYLKRDSDVLYDRNRNPTTTTTFVPIVSPTRQGIVLSVSWR